MIIFELKEVSEKVKDEINSLVSQLSEGKFVELSDLEEIINSESSLIICLKPDKDMPIVGMLTLVFFRIPTGLKAQIEDVVVDSNFRGKGFGKQLVLKALELAREKKVKSVDLTSRPERKEANYLYCSVGFKKRNTNVYRYDL